MCCSCTVWVVCFVRVYVCVCVCDEHMRECMHLPGLAYAGLGPLEHRTLLLGDHLGRGKGWADGTVLAIPHVEQQWRRGRKIAESGVQRHPG